MNDQDESNHDRRVVEDVNNNIKDPVEEYWKQRTVAMLPCEAGFTTQRAYPSIVTGKSRSVEHSIAFRIARLDAILLNIKEEDPYD